MRSTSHSFLREVPQCWLTGQAAGIAGALAVAQGKLPRHVDPADIQRVLLKQNACLSPAIETRFANAAAAE